MIKMVDLGNRYAQGASVMSLLFLATSSDLKFAQYESIFARQGFSLRRGVVFPSAIEPQFDVDDKEGELALVARPLRQSARFAARLRQLPYVLEDSVLVIDAFSRQQGTTVGLPGADTKNWWLNLGNEGVLRLMSGAATRSARVLVQIGIYCGEDDYIYARAVLEGTITTTVRTTPQAFRDMPVSNPLHFHGIFQPLGSSQTLGEMGAADYLAVDYRAACAMICVDQLRTRLPPAEQLEIEFPSGSD